MRQDRQGRWLSAAQLIVLLFLLLLVLMHAPGTGLSVGLLCWVTFVPLFLFWDLAALRLLFLLSGMSDVRVGAAPLRPALFERPPPFHCFA